MTHLKLNLAEKLAMNLEDAEFASLMAEIDVPKYFEKCTANSFIRHNLVEQIDSIIHKNLLICAVRLANSEWKSSCEDISKYSKFMLFVIDTNKKTLIEKKISTSFLLSEKGVFNNKYGSFYLHMSTYEEYVCITDSSPKWAGTILKIDIV